MLDQHISISAELGVEVVYKLCAAVYYSILHVLAYSALASAVISTVICATKKKKA